MLSFLFFIFFCISLCAGIMNSSTMMNRFLQKMLKRSDDELDIEKVESDNRSGKANLSTEMNQSSNWSKNSSLCTPRKSDLMSTTRSPARPIALKLGENRWDYRRKNVSGAGTPRSMGESEGVPSIERIRREFEKGFLSPTKQEAKEMTKSGRFVKTLVAAFEEKYKIVDNPKIDEKRCSVESDSSEDSYFPDEKSVEEMMEESIAILEENCVIESLESRLSRYLNSYIASGVLENPIQESRSDDESSLHLDESSFGPVAEFNERVESIPIEVESAPIDELSDTLDITSDLNENSMRPVPLKSSSRKQLVRRDSSIRRERKPKIVGAFLKKPIEVEDTSIDWIPIIGKKLPRKKSFKRLLSILTGKKWSDKSSKLYSSEINLSEETTRELLQDSGYDEKSGSSSSLTSLASINDLIVQQRNHDPGIYEIDRRDCAMTTFRQPPPPRSEIDSCDDHDYGFETMTDEIYETWSNSSKKIEFEEVSRSDLRLSLGPAFPAAASAASKFTCSLDRREDKSNCFPLSEEEEASEEGEDALIAPPLPKHPFVSLKKKSDKEAENISRHSSSVEIDTERSSSDVSLLDKFDLSLLQNWKFPSEESIEYDVPRNIFSKSDPGLVKIGKFTSSNSLPTENVYDVPKRKISRRPRSSIYDDALSLKRRNDGFSTYNSVPIASEFYGFSSNSEPHYATIKPINARINPYPEFIKSSSNRGLNGWDPVRY